MMWTASALATGRLATGAGAGALGRPRFVSRILSGGNRDQDRSQVLLVRAFAIRDLALGVATMGALRGRSPQAPQLLLFGALCDFADAVLIARHPFMARRPRLLTTATAAVAAAAGTRQALGLRRRLGPATVHAAGPLIGCTARPSRLSPPSPTCCGWKSPAGAST